MIWGIRTKQMHSWEHQLFESPLGTTPEEALLLSPLAEEFAGCTVEPRERCDRRWYILRDGRVVGQIHEERVREGTSRFDPALSLHGGKGARASQLGRHIYH